MGFKDAASQNRRNLDFYLGISQTHKQLVDEVLAFELALVNARASNASRDAIADPV
jgi:hypothetical protein